MYKKYRLLSVFLLVVCSTITHANYSYEYYEGDWSVLPDFDSLTPDASGTVSDFDISIRQQDSQYGFRFTGTITTTVSDTYTFYTNSDDGSQLFIDGTRVVDNDGLHAPIEKSGQIHLSAGQHDIVVTFFEKTGGEVLEVNWSNSVNGRQPIPSDGIIGVLPDLSLVGQWGPVIAWPHVPVSMANLPNGKILSWSGSERRTWPTTEQTYSATWDPVNDQFDEIFHPSHNMFCAHLSMAENGDVFVNGGRNQLNSPWTSLFSYESNSWTQIENMATGGRWYAVTLALPTGEIMTNMGTATNFRNPEKWSPSNSWEVLNGIDYNAMRTTHNGTNGGLRWWANLSVTPDGEVFHFWDSNENHLIDPSGVGSFRDANAVSDDPTHSPGVNVQFAEGKLLVAGGNQGTWEDGASDDAFVIDMNTSPPTVTTTGSMNSRRTFANLVTLPTGEVLAIGGNTSGQAFSDNGTIYEAEIWSPGTGNWRTVAAMQVPRNYHSTALLLTDGRVLAAGGGYNSNDANVAYTHQDGEVYSPPYLFAPGGGTGTVRPTDHLRVPIVLILGEQFTVIARRQCLQRFTMVRMGSTTHAVNTDTRFHELIRGDNCRLRYSSGQYTLSPTANPNLLIPGFWMMFAYRCGRCSF